MALRLEDLFNKKKEGGSSILDLSRIKIRTKEEFEKWSDKIPEFKIRPEKVRYEDCRLREGETGFHYDRKKERQTKRAENTYMDPVPVSMKSVRLQDLAAVDINWRMLTMLRPADKLEEDIFSRLVELGKYALQTQKAEANGQIGGSPPGSVVNNPGVISMKNRRGVVETRCKTCKECFEELCSGQWCKDFPYESYTRMLMDKDELEADEEGGAANATQAKKPEKDGAKGKGAAKTKRSQPTKVKLKGGKLKRVKKRKKKKGKKTKASSSSSSSDS